MNKTNKSLLYFSLLILLLSAITSCTPSTETSKGSLNGTINLEGETDHYGITIALYDLAILDPIIVSINQEYPQIGVHINQHTEFDHRLQSPEKYTETEADGSFELTKIPTGKYNVVAIKDGWGFKYLYDIDISKGDNDLNQQINLYEEIHLSGNIQGSVEVETDHHLVINDDTIFPPNTSSLILHPGAIIRINPAIDLTIHSTFTAQGEEDNMFWVTSNDGFLQTMLVNNINRDEIALYNSMSLTNLASISEGIIQWGKWDWGNQSLLSSTLNADFSNCIFRNNESGLIVSNGSIITIENLLVYDCENSSNGGIVCDDIGTLNIENNIFQNNYNGIFAKFCDNTLISDNYIANNIRGIWGLTIFGDIEHNELISNIECDVKLAGNTTQGEINILNNNLRSNVGIWQYEPGSFSQFYILKINNNNFYCHDMFVTFDSSGHYHGVDIDATYNYYDQAYTLEDIMAKIVDTNTINPVVVSVDVSDFRTSPIPGTGIQ